MVSANGDLHARSFQVVGHPQTEQFHTTPIADVVVAVDGRLPAIEQLLADYDDFARSALRWTAIGTADKPGGKAARGRRSLSVDFIERGRKVGRGRQSQGGVAAVIGGVVETVADRVTWHREPGAEAGMDAPAHPPPIVRPG